MNIKEIFYNKKIKLKNDISELFSEFEKDTGVKIIDIITDTSYNLLTYKILTNIDNENE